MAAWGLDHLKNDYRRRFCRPSSRAPDINTEQGKNILEVLLDCFEEKSVANDFSKNATKSVPYSTPKTKDICIQSSSKETQSQKSHPKSGPVSSRKKEAHVQLTVEPNEAVSKSVQDHEVHQKILATDVRSKNASDLRKMSSKKLKDNHSKADEECYLSIGSPFDLDIKASSLQKGSPSVAQKRETYTSENSVNMLSSSTEISHKTRKRLNFEDKDVLKKVEVMNQVSEIEDKVSEGPQERRQSETSQKRIQDSEYENQPQARKSFSTLFLETVKRKSESSSVVRHVATVPPHLSPANNLKLLEDEFIIDESDKSFVSQPWITIPRKTGPQKQHTASPAESTVLQKKKSRGKQDNVSSMALTSNKHPGKAHPVEKSQPSEQNILGGSCALTDEVENNCKSTKYEIYSENAEKASGAKRTIKPKQRTKSKANVPEEEVDVRQSKDKNISISHTVQDKLQRNSDKNMEEGEEISVSISKNQLLSVGTKKGNTNIPHKKNQKKDKECKKKHFSSGSKKNKIEPEELTSTVTRSRRISRRPSNWWVVKSEQNDSRGEISNSTPESKMHHKLVLPSNTPNVRRTMRTRSKPLEYWRGERINYQGRPSENKFMVNLNIPLGDPLQPTRVKDPETRETVLMDLIRPRDTYQFCVEHDELKVYKTLDTPFFSTGKLILGPNQEKGKQHVGLDTLVFYVNLGHLLCTLHETPYIITTGDSFYVPSGNYYNIKNLLNEESVLLFTQIKS
ncbi:hypothetical protein G4228_004452 [Cervus hanglu yarkandensis]|nr:hypothetical protein G4228_004452 [Cervus hanglu yarkandensis]